MASMSEIPEIVIGTLKKRFPSWLVDAVFLFVFFGGIFGTLFTSYLNHELNKQLSQQTAAQQKCNKFAEISGSLFQTLKEGSGLRISREARHIDLLADLRKFVGSDGYTISKDFSDRVDTLEHDLEAYQALIFLPDITTLSPSEKEQKDNAFYLARSEALNALKSASESCSRSSGTLQ
jgi:hypothetical protein